MYGLVSHIVLHGVKIHRNKMCTN